MGVRCDAVFVPAVSDSKCAIRIANVQTESPSLRTHELPHAGHGRRTVTWDYMRGYAQRPRRTSLTAAMTGKPCNKVYHATRDASPTAQERRVRRQDGMRERPLRDFRVVFDIKPSNRRGGAIDLRTA